MFLTQSGAKWRLGYAFLLLLASYVPLTGQSNKAASTSTEAATCSSVGEMLVELKKLRLELLGFFVVAKHEQISDLELKANELREQRERLETEERRAIQHLGELEAQLASSNAEERERIEGEKTSRSGPALEQLRTRQASLRRREDDIRSLLASEQNRLTQLKQMIAAGAPALR